MGCYHRSRAIIEYQRIKQKRDKKFPIFKELKDLLANFLQENPHTSFSYYELRKYIVIEYREIANSSIIRRVKELHAEGKVSISDCTYKKSRYEIRWITK